MDRNSKVEFWRKHDVLQRESECSIAEYCRREGLNFHTFGYWRNKFKKAPGSLAQVQSFVQVIAKRVVREEVVARLRLQDGQALECLSWPDPEWVRRLGRCE